MKTLIFGAGPLGSLYACLLYKAGIDVTLLARNDHFKFLKENGVVLFNEFTGEKTTAPVKVVDALNPDDNYELVIVIMRKNKVNNILPVLKENKKIPNILFMGNNTLGFDSYLEYLPAERILFGFPGGGGSRIDHVVHYIDTEKPNGKRLPIVIGEIDGKVIERTRSIKSMFETAQVPVKIIDDMNSWQKYHVAFVLPVAGALLKSGDNYKLSEDRETIRMYLRAVKEAGRVLKSLGYRKSYNPKFKLFYLFPEMVLINILRKVFNSKFAEVAMMMHVNAASDEMIELGNELLSLKAQTTIETPNLDELIEIIKIDS
jgi:2-dehydropantoate 2-reductase